MAEVLKFPKPGRQRASFDPFDSEMLTKIYEDCRRTGKPYPLSVFDDFDSQERQQERGERQERGDGPCDGTSDA
jgi:hypothetical protein